jgi:hypothetical protein
MMTRDMRMFGTSYPLRAAWALFGADGNLLVEDGCLPDPFSHYMPGSRSPLDHGEYAAFVRRALRAYSRRVGDGAPRPWAS